LDNFFDTFKPLHYTPTILSKR